RHAKKGVRRMDKVGCRCLAGLVGNAGGDEPGEDTLVVVRLCVKRVWDVRPQQLPQRRLGLLRLPWEHERGQGTTSAQRGSMSRAACRSAGLQGQERDRGAGAAQHTRATAFDEVVGVVADGLLAGGIDQQGLNFVCLALESFAILEKSRAVAI